MNGLEPTCADNLCNPLRIIPVRLHRHRAQSRFDMSTLETHDREALVDQVSADPLRCRTSFQANANQAIPQPLKCSRHGIGVTEHLPLPQHLAGLGDNANSYRVE